MSIFTTEMIQPSIVFWETELDCSGNASEAISLDFEEDDLNLAALKRLEDNIKKHIVKRKHDIHQAIMDHLKAHQLDRKQLADFAGHILHATNFSRIYKKHIDPFLETGYCDSKELRLALLERLELLEPDITIKTPEIMALNAKTEWIKSIQFKAFLRHFDLIWANRVGICATPELANITCHGLGGGLAYTGPFHVTLGQLLNLYNSRTASTGAMRKVPLFMFCPLFLWKCIEWLWTICRILSYVPQHKIFFPV